VKNYNTYARISIPLLEVLLTAAMCTDIIISYLIYTCIYQVYTCVNIIRKHVDRDEGSKLQPVYSGRKEVFPGRQIFRAGKILKVAF